MYKSWTVSTSGIEFLRSSANKLLRSALDVDGDMVGRSCAGGVKVLESWGRLVAEFVTEMGSVEVAGLVVELDIEEKRRVLWKSVVFVNRSCDDLGFGSGIPQQEYM